MCECKDGKMCDLHQFIFDTRMKAQALIDNPPKLNWRQKLSVWWSCYSPAGVKDEFWWTLIWALIVMRLIFG
jgi:hypothetical protein